MPLTLAANVVPPDERNVVAELLPVKSNQPLAMADLFLTHLVKDLCGTGKVLTQVLGEVGVDALVVFFQRYGESEYFTLRKAMEIAQGSSFEKQQLAANQ